MKKPLHIFSSTLLIVGVLYVYCKEFNGAEQATASRLNYPDFLEYDSKSENYTGTPGLPLADELGEEFDVKNADLPVPTFDEAYNVAYKLLTETYSERTINWQLPLMVDYRDDIWIFRGNFPKIEGHIFFGGVAHLAFNGKTGRGLYLYHTK